MPRLLTALLALCWTLSAACDREPRYRIDRTEDSSFGCASRAGTRWSELAPGLELATSSEVAAVQQGVPLLALAPRSILLNGKRIVSITPARVQDVDDAVLRPLVDAMGSSHRSSPSGLLDPEEQQISIAIDRNAPYGAVKRLLTLAAISQFSQYQFIVRDKQGAHHAIHICLPGCCRDVKPVPCWGEPWTPSGLTDAGPEDAGAWQTEVSSIEVIGSKGIEQADFVLPLHLALIHLHDGYRVELGSSREFDPSCSRIMRRPDRDAQPVFFAKLPGGRAGEGVDDVASLRRCLERIKTGQPNRYVILYYGEEILRWADVVRTFDVIRGTKERPLFPRIVFL